jgi:FkbM family methyltransferase
MAHQIFNHDTYNLRKYYPGSVDYFLDIGACVGTTSLLFRTIDPLAKVIALEPSPLEFDYMKTIAGVWGVKCYNMALGNGEQLCFEKISRGCHRFYTEAEKQWWPEKHYLVESKTLPALFKHFKIHGRYIIKVDCEGGERFLLEDKEAIEIIRNAVQFNLEIHYKFGGTMEQWNKWFDNFRRTHNLYIKTKEKDKRQQCIYRQVNAFEKKNRIEYMMVKK